MSAILLSDLSVSNWAKICVKGVMAIFKRGGGRGQIDKREKDDLKRGESQNQLEKRFSRLIKKDLKENAIITKEVNSSNLRTLNFETPKLSI